MKQLDTYYVVLGYANKEVASVQNSFADAVAFASATIALFGEPQTLVIKESYAG